MLRDIDRELLGLRPDPEHPGSHALTVVPHLCRTDGRFYGGAALAAALAASEAVTGRTALWSSTQLVGTAALGEHIDVTAGVVAEGRSIAQVLVEGRVGERLVFRAVGAAAHARPDGIHGTGQTMPAVPPPDDCEAWRGPSGRGGLVPGDGAPTIGHQLVTEHRDAPILDDSVHRPGHMAMWARVSGEVGRTPPVTTPAVLGFVADMVPLAICRAAGVAGAGTSLDNSLRIGDLVDTDWILLDLDADVAVGGLGHGHVRLWSPDGRMLGTGSQSARLFSIDDFIAGQAR